jgi:protocatechuate 3,4-dioxygenase alpha subunit
MYTTSSQTIGPYLHIGMTWLADGNLAPEGVAGDRVTVEGRVVDGDGAPVGDAMLEIWQADPAGRYAHPDDPRALPKAEFAGWGRVFTDPEGRFRFTTVKPGQVPAPDGGKQAPHLAVTIFMRGLLKHLVTRVYFDGDPANADDPLLRRVPAARRGTLLARRKADVLEWNVVLQGEGETVFLEL